MDNYRTIENKLRELKPFKGNSLRAEYDAERKCLDVYSYRTQIARGYKLEGKIGVTYFNANKYSTTTSRHQNLVRRAWGIK